MTGPTSPAERRRRAALHAAVQVYEPTTSQTPDSIASSVVAVAAVFEAYLSGGRNAARDMQVYAAKAQGLSTRERQVLEVIARGDTIEECAGHLGVSASTVKTHLRHMYDKLGATNRAGVVVAAMKAGLLTLEAS